MLEGPTSARSGSARQMRARAGHADAFFYLKGVQLSATHGALWRGPIPGPIPCAPIRLVSYRGNEPPPPSPSSSSPAHGVIPPPLFIGRQNTLDNGVCCSPPGAPFERRHGPARSVTTESRESPRNALLAARVFRIIKPFKYRLRNSQTSICAYVLYIYVYIYIYICVCVCVWARICTRSPRARV